MPFTRTPFVLDSVLMDILPSVFQISSGNSCDTYCHTDCEQIQLSTHGQIADKYIRQLNDFYGHISVDQYAIMPDHIHILLSVQNGQSRMPVLTGKTKIDNKNSAVSKFVSTFKRFCNKEYGENIWQSRYYDHMICNQQDYNEVWEYIENNPRKWIMQNRGYK